MDKSILQEDVRLFAEHFDLSEQLRNKTFLITGATGLIGSVLIKCLIELNRINNLGIKIIAVIRNNTKAINLFAEDYTSINFRCLNLNDITSETINAHVDYIIHLASPTASKYFVEHPVETIQTAINGTAAVLDYAMAAKVESVVYASSLEVYGSNLTDDLITEDFQGYVNPTETRSSYNIGKRACECLCHAYSTEYEIPVTIARLTQTFGAGVEYNDSRVFAQFARNVIEGKNIEMHTMGNTCRMYCYTIDAVSAILYILLKGEKGEAYNVANEKTYISIREMAYFLRDTFNPHIDVIVNQTENHGYAPETKLRLDTRKLEKLGWKPKYGLKEMFGRLIKAMIQ